MIRQTRSKFDQTLTGPLSILLVMLGLIISVGGEAAASNDEPRPTMRAVFEEIKALLPLSLEEDRFAAPESREAILAALARLEQASGALERHGRGREAGFDELALSLGRDFRAARDHYARGDYSEARFFLAGSFQNCVSCHVRLPSDREFPLGAELTKQVEFERLDPRERAWLLVMVRRFEDALVLWEKMLADSGAAPSQLDASGVLVDYLNVTLRVRTDVPRAKQTLAKFAERKDLPVYLEQRVESWRAALDGLDAARLDPKRPADVGFGEALAREGGALASGPYGRDGLIQDLAAASQLVRYLEADREAMRGVTRNRTQDERTQMSRAYYWLAHVEARSLDGFWINLSERHLEAAIRADPRGPFAERAYATLEETQVLGFGGASGEHLPVDIWTGLRDLRELMGRSPASPSTEEVD